MTDAYVDQLPDFVEAFAPDDELVVWNASEADINWRTQGSRWDHILSQLDLTFAGNSELAAHKAAIPLDHADGSVTLAKLANMAADTIRMRSNSLGVPQDLQIGDLPAEPTPVAGDVLLAQKGGNGALVQIDYDDISGGGGTPGGTVEGAIQIRNAAGDGFSAFDNIRVDVGKLVAIAADPNDVPFTVQGTTLQSGNLLEAKDASGTVIGATINAAMEFTNKAGQANGESFGQGSLASVTTAESSCAFGENCLANLETGLLNYASGIDTFRHATSLNNCVGVGTNIWPGANLGAVTNNVGIGTNIATAATSGNGNVAIGASALSSLTTGTANTVSGWQAGQGITSGGYNILFGNRAGVVLTGGTGNIFAGFQSGKNCTTQNFNIGFGDACDTGGFATTILIGNEATANASNQFVTGDPTYPVTNFRIVGTTGAAPTRLTFESSELTVVSGDELGRLDFQAPLATPGGDSQLVGASIFAVATDTFASNVNKTDLVLSSSGGIRMPSLPTSDPAISGALWNNSGVVNISAG